MSGVRRPTLLVVLATAAVLAAAPAGLGPRRPLLVRSGGRRDGAHGARPGRDDLHRVARPLALRRARPEHQRARRRVRTRVGVGRRTSSRVPLPSDLPDGTYTVSWRVVSAAGRPRHRGRRSLRGGRRAVGAPRRRDHLRGDDARALAAQRDRQGPALRGAGRSSSAPSRRRSSRSAATCPSRRRLLPLAGALTLVGAARDGGRRDERGRRELRRALPLPRGQAPVWLAVGAAATALGALYAVARRRREAPSSTAGVAAAITMYTRARGGPRGAWAGGSRSRSSGSTSSRSASGSAGSCPCCCCCASGAERTSRHPPAEVGPLLDDGRHRAARGRDRRHPRRQRSSAARAPLVHIFDTSYGTVLAPKVGARPRPDRARRRQPLPLDPSPDAERPPRSGGSCGGGVRRGRRVRAHGHAHGPRAQPRRRAGAAPLPPT